MEEDTLDGGFAPDTVRRTPSVTAARGFAVVEDLSAEDPASGDTIDARGPGLVGATFVAESVAERAGVGFAGAVAPAAVRAAGVAALVAVGASDWRREGGTGGGGMALEAAVDDLAVALAVEGFAVGVAVPVLEAFFRVEVADDAGLEGGAAADVLEVAGVDLTVPEPNLPESMI